MNRLAAYCFFTIGLLISSPVHAGIFDDLLDSIKKPEPAPESKPSEAKPATPAPTKTPSTTMTPPKTTTPSTSTGSSGLSSIAGSLLGSSGPSLDKVVAGLKEALSLGTGNAVSVLSNPGGYLKNEAVKIMLPEKVQGVGDMLRKVGLGKQVDEFVGSMNLAAESAADKAGPIFIDAVKEMSFDDAKKILEGSNTAATEYLKSKTQDKIATAFRPIIAKSMNEVGATRAYQSMIGEFDSIPFVKRESVDLEPYVTEKAMDGIFHMVGEEEKKIRTNPQARVTDLLKDVFGK